MRCIKITLLGLWALLLSVASSVQALTISETKPALPAIEVAFPEVTRIGDKAPVGAEDGPLVRTVYRGEEVLGYAYETADVLAVPAYSGEPINMLVALDTEGRFLEVRVLEHHEPILLVGIPEQKLFDFVDQYRGLQAGDRVRVGTGGTDVRNVDAITGATVTVMVVNETLMRSALKVGQALELAGLSATDEVPPATIKGDLFRTADWQTLTGDGSIRRLHLNRGQVDDAFAGTRAAKGEGKGKHRDELFIDLYYAPLNAPTIGRNLLGDDQYAWLMTDLAPGDQAIAVFGKGRYSFKGNGYVRGGIFDRTQLQQNGKTIIFHDSDYHRLSDIYIDGFPGFDEMMIFIVRDHYGFDPGAPWQLELVVRRQIGALDSLFTSFYGDYQIPEAYIERPAPPVAEELEAEPLWVSIWRDKAFQIGVLSISLLLLTAIIFLQDALVRYPRLLHNLRHLFLAYTVVFIGWYALGQLSVVNVFTFVHAVMDEFHWELFLLDPVIFILWAYVAMTLILWGRGIFCGWLCPFGALQELLNLAARRFGIRQFEPPFAVHQRLWALKYIILLVLFAISLESLGEAERYAEVEPFKTAIMLKFQREWGFVLYAGLLLFASLFTRKLYCRYLCPLGAALVIPSKFRIFDWLRRRRECGNPCRVCANECEIQAIEPDGRINANECHHCLDCQMTYYNAQKCPPLVARARKRRKQAWAADAEQDRIPVVEVGRDAS